ncbi:unnamed protein product, partial [Symbiodinium microadriaticum]
RSSLDQPTDALVEGLMSSLPTEGQRQELRAAAESYAFWWNTYFSHEHDPSALHGENNDFRYRPLPQHVVRVGEGEVCWSNILKSYVLCQIGGISWTWSVHPDVNVPSEVKNHLPPATVEATDVFVTLMETSPQGSFRVMGTEPLEPFYVLKRQGHRLLASECLANGRLEWLGYLREQSITEIVHRHGNTTSRQHAEHIPAMLYAPALYRLSLAIAFLAVLSGWVRAAERPNIVWIIADDLSPELGCYGYEGVRTPHIDRIADEGWKYEAAFATAPVCSSSRSAFITGVYQTATGTHHHRTEVKRPLPPPVVPITKLLSDAGYFVTNSNSTISRPGKTDYNFTTPGKLFDGFDWSKRAKGQPFFAQVQIHEPHRSFIAAKDKHRADN